MSTIPNCHGSISAFINGCDASSFRLYLSPWEALFLASSFIDETQRQPLLDVFDQPSNCVSTSTASAANSIDDAAMSVKRRRLSPGELYRRFSSPNWFDEGGTTAQQLASGAFTFRFVVSSLFAQAFPTAWLGGS